MLRRPRLSVTDALQGETVSISGTASRKTRPHTRTAHAHGPADPRALAWRVPRACLSVVHTAELSEHDRDPERSWPRRAQLLLRLPAAPEEEPAGTDPPAPHQRPRSLRGGSSFQPQATPAGVSTLIFFCFFLQKKPPTSLAAGPAAPAAAARRTPSAEPPARTGPRRAEGAGRRGSVPAVGAALPAAAAAAPWPPRALVSQVGHGLPQPRCASVTFARAGPRRAGTGGARARPRGRKGRPRPRRGRGAGRRDAPPSPGLRSARVGAGGPGPADLGLPAASGWQVVGDGWTPGPGCPRGGMRRVGHPTHSSRFQEGPGPCVSQPLPPAGCSGLHVSHLMNCPGWAALLRVATQQAKRWAAKATRFCLWALRRLVWTSRPRSPGGPRAPGHGGLSCCLEFSSVRMLENSERNPDKFWKYHGIMSNLRRNFSGNILLVTHSQVRANGP